MEAGIMGDVSTVDVRDMVCAQALAVVARAFETVVVGSSLGILYNAEDVKHDLLVWARERHLTVTDEDSGIVRLRR